MRIFYTVILMLFLSFSGAYAQDVELLKKEVMEVHDIAMAKMTHMHELKLGLQAMEKSKGVTVPTTKAIDDLQSAHKGMMQWMRQYKPPQATDAPEAAISYLEDEMVKIQQVSDAINSSIAEAEKLLDQ